MWVLFWLETLTLTYPDGAVLNPPQQVCTIDNIWYGTDPSSFMLTKNERLFHNNASRQVNVETL